MPGITKMQRSVMAGIADAKGTVGFDTVESNIQSIEQLAKKTTATHEYYPGYGGTVLRAERTVYASEMEGAAAALEKLADSAAAASGKLQASRGSITPAT